MRTSDPCWLAHWAAFAHELSEAYQNGGLIDCHILEHKAVLRSELAKLQGLVELR